MAKNKYRMSSYYEGEDDLPHHLLYYRYNKEEDSPQTQYLATVDLKDIYWLWGGGAGNNKGKRENNKRINNTNKKTTIMIQCQK